MLDYVGLKVKKKWSGYAGELFCEERSMKLIALASQKD
jgi:hypothetical protein